MCRRARKRWVEKGEVGKGLTNGQNSLVRPVDVNASLGTSRTARDNVHNLECRRGRGEVLRQGRSHSHHSDNGKYELHAGVSCA